VKRYSKISGMTIATCDRKGCAQEFRSCSIPKVIDLQVLGAGWLIIEIEIPRSLTWETKYLCPAHTPTRGHTVNGLHWREKAINGRAGSTSGQSRISH
jgi:hypothetical protein